MRRLALLAFGVPLVAGCGWLSALTSGRATAQGGSAIGRRHLGIRFQIAHLKCPSCVNQDSPMPPFASLGKRRLHELAVFLEASKGTH